MSQIIARLSRGLVALIATTALFNAPAIAQGLIRDSEIEAVMRAYTNPLLGVADLEASAVDIYLVGDMEFNAFVTQGQNIFLNTGLIVRAQTPNEIKGVIAHEIGHIELAHLARMDDAARGSMATMVATIGVGLLAALAGEGGAGAAIMASGPQFAQLDFLRYTRGQEASADQAAVRLLDGTGQSGRGLVSTFERLAYQERISFQRRWEYFRSHPLSADRVSALRRNVEESPYADVEDTPEEIAQLERIQAKIIGFMVPPGQTLDRYPESDTSIPARYARSVAWFKQGLTERAVAEIDGLIELEPENPYFHELRAQILFESGLVAEAIPSQRQALALRPDDALLKIYLGRALVATGEEEQAREAVTVLSQAVITEPGNAFAWFQKALAHQALNEVPQAELATAERYYAAGDEMQAHIFARRAHEELDRGSEAWIRAAEILAVTTPSQRQVREWNRRERDRQPNFATHLTQG